jgi:hypothetical protein
VFEEDAFDIVINLNKNRIFGRLASRHFKPPLHDRGPPRKALSERFKALTNPSKHDHHDPDVEEFYHQIESFHAASIHIENSNADLSAIKCAVKAAFQLTADGFSLLGRLQKANVPPSAMDRREVREINKLGNYWRICLNFAHLSRSYRSLFASLRLELIEPFSASTSHGSGVARHVHAEVQMLVHYEIRGRSTSWPRAIGVSKEACFLCSSLIKSHGLFYVSKAHRQVYPRWTIPDLLEYSPESLHRLQKAVLAIRQDVGTILRQARRKPGFRLCPLQSSTNLHKPIFPTPSVTTVASSSTRETVIARDAIRFPSEHAPPPTPQEVERSETHRRDQCCETPRRPASHSLKKLSLPGKKPKIPLCHNSLTQ